MLGRLLKPPGDDGEERAWSFAQLGWPSSLVSDVYSPVNVTVSKALTHAASSACIDVLASSTSATPIDVVREQGGARLPVPTPPLIAAPSAIVETDVWVYQIVESMLTDGNGFGMVTTTDRLGRPTSIEPVDAGQVTGRQVVGGVPQASLDGKVYQLYPFGDLWHVPGKFVRAGSPFGQSPIARAASTIGSAIAAREFGARFFGDGGHPGGIITADTTLSPDQAKEIKAAWINAVSGTREPAVLGSGLKYDPIMVDPNDSQFLDLMRFAIEEACRFWRVPPSMVYAATSGQNVTYANVSQADLHYLKHSLEWLFVRLERALSKLIVRPQTVRFNRNAFLRSDAQTRGEYLDKRLRNKTISVNEYRALEDEKPFDDKAFDEPGIPGQDTTGGGV